MPNEPSHRLRSQNKSLHQITLHGLQCTRHTFQSVCSELLVKSRSFLELNLQSITFSTVLHPSHVKDCCISLTIIMHTPTQYCHSFSVLLPIIVSREDTAPPIV